MKYQMIGTAAVITHTEYCIQLQMAGEPRVTFTCLPPYYLRGNSFPSASSGDLKLQLFGQNQVTYAQVQL